MSLSASSARYDIAYIAMLQLLYNFSCHSRAMLHYISCRMKIPAAVRSPSETSWHARKNVIISQAERGSLISIKLVLYWDICRIFVIPNSIVHERNVQMRE